MTDPDAVLTITPKGERWARNRHPWVYRDDLVKPEPSLSGRVVRVASASGSVLGQAFYNAKSKIALRWLTQDPLVEIGRDFWLERLQTALEYRRRVVSQTNAYRLIHSEADGFPGLVVDRYNELLVVQSLCLGIERMLPLLVELLQELLHPQSIVARHDSPIRALEGLPKGKSLLLGGEPGTVEIEENGIRYRVDVWEGQKTGFFLDQRENRRRARSFAKGRVLDAFSYMGGFALSVAGSCEEVLAVEDSQWALERLKDNIELNGFTNVRVEKDNVFGRLKKLEAAGDRFDLVVLDPPAFAKSKEDLKNAWRGYREINLRSLRILKPGGVLISCSCSHQITSEMFCEILREASRDARRSCRILEERTQALDHPIMLSHPESKYLKCFILEVL